MKICIELEIKERDGESRENAEQRVDRLLCFGTVKDSFDAAGIDLVSIQVVNTSSVKSSDWKHGKFYQPLDGRSPDAIVVFDDEDAGCDSIYKRYGAELSPCRTVDRSNAAHWVSVLSAWAKTAPLEDRRQDRSVALPE